MADCGLLTSGFAPDCANPLVGGVEKVGIFINRADWENATIVYGTLSNEIVSISLPTGKLAYSIEGYPNTLRPRVSASKENGLTRRKHIVDMQLFDDSASAEEMLEKLGFGEYVIIVFTNSKKIKIYGGGTGLLYQPQDPETDSYVNNSAAQLTFASDDEALEVKRPFTFIGTATTYSFPDAKAEILALLS